MKIGYCVSEGWLNRKIIKTLLMTFKNSKDEFHLDIVEVVH